MYRHAGNFEVQLGQNGLPSTTFRKPTADLSDLSLVLGRVRVLSQTWRAASIKVQVQDQSLFCNEQMTISKITSLPWKQNYTAVTKAGQVS